MENSVVKSKISDVQKFYSGKNIFLTGGTGFIGRIIVEKLLRSCHVGRIYFLIREKKGKSTQERIKDLFSDVLFDRLRQQNPEFLEKIHPIAGDCLLPGLGISPQDRELLCKIVNVVFHMAATVRFDEQLRVAMAINVRSTRDILHLCRQIENLEAVLHISTAYANSNRRHIDEKFYKYSISGVEALKMFEDLDDETFERISSEHSKSWYNNYVFTKSLAEDLIRTESKGLPVAMFRPALVVSTAYEPIVGWTNNLYGPNGIIMGIAIGGIHVYYGLKNNNLEFVPVDMCANAILVCAQDRATQEHTSIPIVNYVTSPKNIMTWQHINENMLEHGLKMHTMKSFWYVVFTVTESRFMFELLWFLYHTLPAFFVDIGFRLAGKKPRAMATYRKVKKFYDAILKGLHKNYNFTAKNMELLWERLSQEDRKIFYCNMEDINWNTYAKNYLLGIRQYFLKDPLSTIPAARKRQQRLKILHYFVIYTLYILLGILLAKLLM